MVLNPPFYATERIKRGRGIARGVFKMFKNTKNAISLFNVEKTLNGCHYHY